MFAVLTLLLALPNLEMQRKIDAALLIEDFPIAIETGKKALEEFPELPESYELLLKALSKAAKEEEMLGVWERFFQKFPKDAMKDKVLEELCWGTLRKGLQAEQLSTRLIALIGSAITQDIYAVNILKEHMHNPSAILRQVAIELGALYGDATLKEEIAKRFQEEKLWSVREEIYKAIGEMKIKSLLPELMQVVKGKKAGSFEKATALKAIAKVHEKPSHEELKMLIASPSSGYRILACKLMVDSFLQEEGELLEPLLKDSHREVRKEALQAFGKLRLKMPSQIATLANSKDAAIGVIASWALLLSDPQKGEEAFSKWLFHEKEEVRIFAAGAIATSGLSGAKIAEMLLEQTEDPFVRANFAIAMLRQRLSTEKAADVLYTFLKEYKGKLMMSKERFQVLQKSTMTHDPLIPNHPEVVNQVTRLELLNLLAIVEYPHAESAIREFLKESQWAVVGVAAEALLSEGDESAIALVQKLMEESDKTMRLEAALLLAVWGREKAALPYLMEAYPEASRELKVKILESIGRLGERETIPFLVQRLKDPSQLFRLVAASVLIQTLHQ